jgi:hypothetical protein
MMFSKQRETSGSIGAWQMGFALLIAGSMIACQESPAAPELGSDGDEGVLDEGALAMAAYDADEMAAVMAEAEVEANRTRPSDQRRPDLDRFGIVVELSGTAVGLAGRILDEQGADEEQKRLLRAAQLQQRKAVAALAQGDTERAVAYAIDACWTALKAIVLPGGVTEEEVRFIHDLAHDLLEEAILTVGDSRSIDQTLLDWAVQFYVVGAQQLEEGQVRGVASLWKAAIISAHIIG